MSNRNILFKMGTFLIGCLLLVVWFGPVNARPRNEIPQEGGSFPITTLFTSVDDHPLSNVPGHPGIIFGGSSNPFIDIYGSPNGNWITTALTSYIGGSRTILVNGEAKIFENDPAQWPGDSDPIWNILSKVGITDDGWWVFPVSTDGPTPNSNYIIKVSPDDVYSIAVQEGNPAPQIPGASWGFTLHHAVIANGDATGWVDNSLSGPSPSQNTAFVFDGDLLGQMGVTIPNGQVNNNSWDGIVESEFFVSADGDHWSIRGYLKGDSAFREVFVVDNTVVAQEGTILANSNFSEEIETFYGSFMDHAGNWYVRGTNKTTGHDWIYRNGEVIAERNTPIHIGASELFNDTNFSTTFNLHVGDSYGNYVIAGQTNNPDPYANFVLVANNQTVVLREDDPIDLNNNGIFDDDAYIDFISNNEAFLDDYGTLHFLSLIRDGSNDDIGGGIFEMDLSSILNYPEPDNFAYLPFTARLD